MTARAQSSPPSAPAASNAERPTVTGGGETRVQTPDERLTATFTEAWMNCMTVHDGTLVSGPCNACVTEYAKRLTDLATGASS